jgi:hypothetical protein
MSLGPFESGLPGDVLRAEAEASAKLGLAQLDVIRRWALDQVAELAPATQNRFDGVERVEASAAAIEAVDRFREIVRLVDGLKRDGHLARCAALILQAGAK